MIVALIPLALRGVRFRAASAAAVLRRNLLVYGVGGLVAPFVGIKAIDLVLGGLGDRLMRRQIVPALVAFLALTVLTGIAYPLAVTGVSQLAFGDQANGSLLERDGRVVGSELIGQPFAARALLPAAPLGGRRRVRRDGELRVEPRADEPGPARLRRRAARRLSRAERPRPGRRGADRRRHGLGLGTRSAHLSRPTRACRPRASPRSADSSSTRSSRSIEAHTAGRSLGFLGEPGVNVLELNLALDDRA